MTEYKISLNRKTIFYNNKTDEIMLGSPSFDGFTDSEISEYLSDFLTHENIHMVINGLFDNSVSKLFDGIEYIFRNDELHTRILFKQHGLKRITYQTYIKKYGFEKFLHHYKLDKSHVTNANTLCNTRKELYEWVEIFGVPQHRQIENIQPDDIIRIYPNHVIIKIEVV